MFALPSGVPALSFLLILLGDVLVFVLVGWTFRLLSPRKVAPVIWASPVVHAYTLFAALLAVYEGLSLSSHPLSTLLGAFGLLALAAVAGGLTGRALGHRIPVSLHADGHWYFTGGRLLVALLVVLLLPLALEQAIVLLGSLAGVGSLVQAIDGAPPFDLLLVAVGFLFVLGTFLSITWRFEVWGKRGHRKPSSASSVAR